MNFQLQDVRYISNWQIKIQSKPQRSSSFDIKSWTTFYLCHYFYIILLLLILKWNRWIRAFKPSKHDMLRTLEKCPLTQTSNNEYYKCEKDEICESNINSLSYFVHIRCIYDYFQGWSPPVAYSVYRDSHDFSQS